MVLITFLFTAVVIKLIYVGIVNADNLRVRALEQWYRDVPLKAERGHILDRNGVVLAASETVYTLYARPVSVRNKQSAAAVIAEILELDYEKLYKNLNSHSSEITLKRGVDKETMLRIVDSGIEGIYVSEDIKRVYPYGDFMTQVLGFTNTDADGQTGVEAYYNAYLKGNDGYVLTSADLVGRELEDSDTYYVEGTPGADVYLTLDYYIQSIVENAVERAMLAHSAKGVAAVVMNCNTGEILALAESPSFDLNNVPRDDVQALLEAARPKIVSDVFEPGSTFKIITSALAIEAGLVNDGKRYYCGGSMTVDGQKIRCWRSIGHGSQSFAEGVKNSCNCVFMSAALELGVERFYEGIAAFGLNVKTGIDMSGEGSGLTIPMASVKNVDLARIGFGQAVAVTPIGLLAASAAAVNGGLKITPSLVAKIENESGILYGVSTRAGERVVSEATSATLRSMLETVVLEGSGKNAAVEGVRVGGKTGTAQKYENGQIARGKYISTFIGFAPAEAPEYITLFMVDEPVGAYYGGVVAAPYVGEIYTNMFAYLK